MSGALIIPVWLTLVLALPVLGLGGSLVRRIRNLDRFSIPAPVVGGLIFALAVLAANVSGWSVRCETGTTWKAWTWLVTAEPDWQNGPVKSANLPFLAVFFASVGLGARWSLVRQAGRQVLIFLVVVSGLAVLQNVLGLALAWLLGVSPLLGLVCGSMSMTGGHATTLGFAAEFERVGLAGAQTFGMAAATLGLLAGALLSGPVGRSLIRRYGLQTAAPQPVESDSASAGGVEGGDSPRMTSPVGLVAHVLLLVFCLKAGAWLSYGLHRAGWVFPVFVGTLLVGVSLRLVLDRWSPAWFRPQKLDTLGSAALGIFLATAMMTLNLRELAGVAGPMLVILGGQILLAVAFARWATFRVMGRDYDAAVMAGGHCGFGLGSTATAVAGMKALVEKSGAAPRAFLIVPLVGGFLVDLVNALNLTTFISLVRPH